MTKCNQLTHLSFKGLMYFIMGMNVWNNYGGGVGKYFAWTATHSWALDHWMCFLFASLQAQEAVTGKMSQRIGCGPLAIVCPPYSCCSIVSRTLAIFITCEKQRLGRIQMGWGAGDTSPPVYVSRPITHRLASFRIFRTLTLSLPIPLRFHTFPYWSNPPFLCTHFWHSGTLALRTEHQSANTSEI